MEWRVCVVGSRLLRRPCWLAVPVDQHDQLVRAVRPLGVAGRVSSHERCTIPPDRAPAADAGGCYATNVTRRLEIVSLVPRARSSTIVSVALRLARASASRRPAASSLTRTTDRVAPPSLAVAAPRTSLRFVVREPTLADSPTSFPRRTSSVADKLKATAQAEPGRASHVKATDAVLPATVTRDTETEATRSGAMIATRTGELVALALPAALAAVTLQARRSPASAATIE